MKRINNYLNLPLPAQRALDRYWLSRDELDMSLSNDVDEKETIWFANQFDYAAEVFSKTFRDLGLSTKPFLKPISI